MILFWVNVAATFGVFSAVVWRLRICRHPTGDARSQIQWLLWLAVHMGVAIPVLMLLGDSLDGKAPPPMHLIVLKFSLTVMLLAPWKRREEDKR